MKTKTVKIYRMDPTKFPKERQTILRLYWGTIISLIIVAFIFITLRKISIEFLWWLPIIVGLLLYYMANGIRVAQRNIDEYTLEWDGETVKQNTPGMPDLTLRVNEIANVELTREGLELSTQKHHNLLTIPSSLSEADLAELKDELTTHLRLKNT